MRDLLAWVAVSILVVAAVITQCLLFITSVSFVFSSTGADRAIAIMIAVSAVFSASTVVASGLRICVR